MTRIPVGPIVRAILLPALLAGVDAAPIINVTGNTIAVDLNAELGYETQAQVLVDAINSDPAAGALVRARVAAGNRLADITTPDIDYSPLDLEPV